LKRVGRGMSDDAQLVAEPSNSIIDLLGVCGEGLDVGESRIVGDEEVRRVSNSERGCDSVDRASGLSCGEAMPGSCGERRSEHRGQDTRDEDACSLMQAPGSGPGPGVCAACRVVQARSPAPAHSLALGVASARSLALGVPLGACRRGAFRREGE